MKKCGMLLAALLLVLVTMTGALADVPDRPRDFAYAYDFSGDVLSRSDMQTIHEYGEALERATGAQAIAVVVDFLDGEDPADYATDLINTWGIGDKKEDNGIVVLLARGDRRIQIGTGRGIDRVLTGSKAGDLIDDNIDYFANDRFDKGMVSLYEDVCRYVARAEGKKLVLSDGSYDEGYYEEEDEGSFFDLLLGLLFFYIMASVFINTLFHGRSCCLKMFFLGWLFDRSDRRYNGRRPPRTGGFGGGSSWGGGSGSSFRGSSGSFGGGSSRGGGGGRSF